MELDRDGREYAHAGFHDLPSAPPAPEIWLEAQWRPMAWWDDYADPEWQRQAALHKITQQQAEAGTHRLARILVAGPDATSNPDGTVTLTATRSWPRSRLGDTTEVLIRNLDPIDLTG